MAHHKSFSKQRWTMALKHEVASLEAMHSHHIPISALFKASCQRYQSSISPHCKQLTDTSQILELGCGATCLAQSIEHGKKTYLDPLLDNYRRIWPGGLPKGNFISGIAEEIHQNSASYDLILAVRMISYSENPELVLHEVERLLKPNGTFLLSVETWPEPFARLHYYTANFFPQWTLKNRLYCYTTQGIENSLKRHFNIESKQALPPLSGFSLKREYFYVCSPLPSSEK